MKVEQVAAQLYTVREFTQTWGDFADTLKKIRAIGYPAVQLSAQGAFPEEDMLRLATDEGITLCATHEPGAMILDEPQKVVEKLAKLQCKYTAFPHPGAVPMSTLAEVKDMARRLNEAGKVLHEAGQVLTYHNHNTEFQRFDGRLMLDVLYDETDPRFLQGEPDTYWVQYGGGDPVAWCEKLKGRLPLLHMKDYRTNTKNAPEFAEIGYGNLDWKRIVAAADAAGCEWYIVEQDTCPGNPFDSLKKSFDYISGCLCA